MTEIHVTLHLHEANEALETINWIAATTRLINNHCRFLLIVVVKLYTELNGTVMFMYIMQSIIKQYVAFEQCIYNILAYLGSKMTTVLALCQCVAKGKMRLIVNVNTLDWKQVLRLSWRKWKVIVGVISLYLNWI